MKYSKLVPDLHNVRAGRYLTRHLAQCLISQEKIGVQRDKATWPNPSVTELRPCLAVIPPPKPKLFLLYPVASLNFRESQYTSLYPPVLYTKSTSIFWVVELLFSNMLTGQSNTPGCQRLRVSQKTRRANRLLIYFMCGSNWIKPVRHD